MCKETRTYKSFISYGYIHTHIHTYTHIHTHTQQRWSRTYTVVRSWENESLYQTNNLITPPSPPRKHIKLICRVITLIYKVILIQLFNFLKSITFQNFFPKQLDSKSKSIVKVDCYHAVNINCNANLCLHKYHKVTRGICGWRFETDTEITMHIVQKITMHIVQKIT